MSSSGYFLHATEFGTIRCVLTPTGAISRLEFDDENKVPSTTDVSVGRDVSAEMDTPEWFNLDGLIKGFNLTGQLIDFGNATEFQIKVWKAAMTIPCGRTITYSELANIVGCPKAHRAVASALASNNIAIIIPCHRVIRKDGSLGGYKWGLNRKKALLDYEKKCVD